MILLTLPRKTPESLWIAEVVLNEFLGMPYAVIESPRPMFCLSMDDRYLELPDIFFKHAATAWCKPESLATLPLKTWNVSTSGLNVPHLTLSLPVLFGQPDITISANRISFGADILGTAFYMLSRYEESVLPDRDIHDRFPAAASLAFRAGFLDRPIVDEYVEVLWVAMKRLWPRLQRKSRLFQQRISCDVDTPYSYYVKSIRATLKTMGGDVLKRKSPALAIQTSINAVYSALGYYQHDPVNTFSWIMNENEKMGNLVSFYFIAGHSVAGMDGYYSLEEPRIRALMRHIHERGHEIGLHGSYGTYQDAEQYKKEVASLRRVMEEEKIDQLNIGNRQHYLRWCTSRTATILDEAGIHYDTTLSYADYAGFRCGTCHEYPMFDVERRLPLKLRQRPLIVMECSVMDACYMGLGEGGAALDFMQLLKHRCQQVDGQFSLLWHNSSLKTPHHRSIYRDILSYSFSCSM